MADHRPNRYEEDGRVVYRASALGSCVKTLVALGLGMTPADHPDWLKEKFAQGSRGESVVIDELRANWRIMDQAEGHYFNWDDGQLYVEVNVGSRVVIRGHADAIGTCYRAPVMEYGETDWVTGDRRLIEVKCVTEDYARDIIRKLPPMYAWQVSVYGGAFRLPVMMALGVKDENGDVEYVLTEMVDELPYTMGQVKARVMEIERWIADGELPNCDQKQWPCPYSWMCDEVVDAEGKPRTRDEELEDVLKVSIRKAKANQ